MHKFTFNFFGVLLLFCTIMNMLPSCGDDDENEEYIYTEDNEQDNEPTQNYEGSVDGHDYIDLGLSVKWAKTNLGASTPSAYGNYYAWAETITKTSYWSNTYKFYNLKTDTYSAPTTSICGTKYDAATYYWGSKWRLPSKDEAEELINKCTWEETTLNGVSCFKVTGRNGQSIFLPRAGSFTGYDKGALSGIWAQFWTGSYAAQSAFYFHAYSLNVSSVKPNVGRKEVSGHDVYDGISIRPVTTASGNSSTNGGNNNGGSTGGGNVGDLYETNFNSTSYTDKIKVVFYFSERLSSATIKYGTSSSCSSSKSATVIAKSATATVTGLKPGTKYYFKCVAKSTDGQTCTTSVYPVMTNYQR